MWNAHLTDPGSLRGESVIILEIGVLGNISCLHILAVARVNICVYIMNTLLLHTLSYITVLTNWLIFTVLTLLSCFRIVNKFLKIEENTKEPLLAYVIFHLTTYMLKYFLTIKNLFLLIKENETSKFEDLDLKHSLYSTKSYTHSTYLIYKRIKIRGITIIIASSDIVVCSISGVLLYTNVNSLNTY